MNYDTLAKLRVGMTVAQSSDLEEMQLKRYHVKGNSPVALPYGKRADDESILKTTFNAYQESGNMDLAAFK
jgi:hypothetical protein